MKTFKTNHVSRLVALLLLAISPAHSQTIEVGETVVSAGNPIIPGIGMADPHGVVFGDRVYVYAGSDFSPDNKHFVMKEWCVWSTSDFVNWKKEGTLQPDVTYVNKPSDVCWAGFCVRRGDKYYWYISGARFEIGVVVGDTPSGPWKDPVGKPLVKSRDPDIFEDDDGNFYMIYGVFKYFIVRLNDDMISFAEQPREVVLDRQYGPSGQEKTDDKPSLHKRDGLYYLSWSSFYATSPTLYGPYTFKGSVIDPANVATEFTFPKKNPLYIYRDRHGNFFTFRNQWYYIVNDQSQPGRNAWFRDACLAYVHYKDNGDIAPIRLDAIGVGQYDANQEKIEAENFFDLKDGEVRESPAGGFEVRGLSEGSHVVYPNIRNVAENATLSLSVASGKPTGCIIEFREGKANGEILGACSVPATGGWHKFQTLRCPLKLKAGTHSLCLTFKGGADELVRLDWLSFAPRADK